MALPALTLPTALVGNISLGVVLLVDASVTVVAKVLIGSVVQGIYKTSASGSCC